VHIRGRSGRARLVGDGDSGKWTWMVVARLADFCESAEEEGVEAGQRVRGP